MKGSLRIESSRTYSNRMGLTFNELPVYFTVSAEASYDLWSTDAAVRDAAHSIHSSSYTEIAIRT